MKHSHKAIPAKARDTGWTHCVTPVECAANHMRQRAHGNITIIDRCSCGAVRYSESNAGPRNYGPWLED